MRLLLIRHGETVDNVAGIYAGTTDSALTTHGVIQASRLGTYLAATDVKISHIFCSDLQRAYKTAEALILAQPLLPNTAKASVKLQVLQEQDFGFYEGKRFSERPRGGNRRAQEARPQGFIDVESKESMTARADAFINDYLVQLFAEVGDEDTVAVVSHGVILSYLWRRILARFEAENVHVNSGILASGNRMDLEYLGGWSNTGYFDLEIKSKVFPAQSAGSIFDPKISTSIGKSKGVDFAASLPNIPPIPTSIPGHASGFTVPALWAPRLPNTSLVVKAVNSLEHLKGLKKTRGGIGSSKHDATQKSMDSFLKGPKPA